jgi:hypothetical protein
MGHCNSGIQIRHTAFSRSAANSGCESSMKAQSSIPFVSILLPVFNCEIFLDAAIVSMRCQTLDNVEIVAVNDGSTDGSARILREHAAVDKRIRVIEQSNQGIAAALNTGIEWCRGQYIARMDGDDIAEPDRLMAQVAFLENNIAIGCVGGWATNINDAGQFTGTTRLPVKPHEVNAALDRGSYAILHPTIMLRHTCLDAIGNYDPAFRYAEDLDLLLRLREVTQLANLPRTVLKYRKRSSSMSDAGVSKYPAWDQKALLATHARGRRPVPASTLARAAERVSWTALDSGDFGTAVRQAWQAVRHAPLNVAGPRALARVGRRWATGSRGAP